MSGSSSPLNGGYEAAGGEPAMRLTVRKDLFPSVRIPKLGSTSPDETMLNDEFEDVSCVKLETDFEQSIDDIANQKLQVVNGALPSFSRPRHRKHKQHSRHDMERPTNNGCLPPESKRRKSSSRNSKYRTSQSNNALVYQVKGGKNLNLVSSSEYQDVDDEESSDNEVSEESESSEDEVLKCSVKLPLVNVPRQSGKPYSHQLSQLSTKKNKSKESSKERRTHTVAPCSGKPRSMLDICCSRSKKKSKKSNCTATYRSQIVGTKSKIKIKIRRTSVHQTITPTPTSIADLGQRKSKKKRAASPVPSESSGEEYDPSRGDTAAAMSVAAPKPRHQPTRTRKTNKSKSKEKSEKTERTRVSATENKVKETGPQSPWGFSMPEEILTKIFDYVVTSQGTLPTLVRLGRVCKLWHSVSCRPELWRNVDLAQHTIEKCKTDYKLVWLLENRLSQCQTLNIAQWKVCNVTWVLACVAEYCTNLVELSVAGWSRLTPEQLFDLVQGLPKLQRLDLSLTSETGGSSTCLSATSVARVVENFGSRLTHLTLANNKFTALPQILASIAAHCPRLEVLDISGALATSHPAAVPLEALQRGCPRMRVFRAANAQLVLAAASQRTDCPGWEALEELSVAGEAAAERACVGEYRLGDDALARLVRGATRLRLLDLRGLQRLSDSGLVRVPAWDLHHLFLGGCNVLRQSNACLELICEKWSHSLVELDLSWASATRVLDDAVRALADSATSKLRILNLCGSSVSLEPVKKVLLKCPHIESINLSSCRALPRGMKRLYTGKELQDLKDSLDPQKVKAKEEDSESDSEKKKDTKKSNTTKTDTSRSPNSGPSDTSENKSKAEDDSSLPLRDTRSESESSTNVRDRHKSSETPPDTKTIESSFDKESVDNTTSLQEGNYTTRNTTSTLLSPSVSRPDSSSTPRSEPAKMDIGSPHFSPVTKPDSQIQNSPEVLSESLKSSNSWNLGQFKTTPTHKSEASPLNRSDCHTKMKISKTIEQCSPTTSVDNKPSPEAGSKQDMKSSSSWNYGNYSPMTRQENQFPSQRSPYSAQPSPAQPQPSPYSAQPSPYSTQPSPYSSQPSPYSAQPSPDTSQMVKPDIQKSTAWNTGNYSPMPKHHAPFSPLPSTHPSPDPGLAKSEAIRSTPNRTSGQYSPMSRQDRLHQSPYSPRASADMAYGNKRSPGVGGYSPLMRTDCHLPSSDANSVRSLGRTQDAFGRPVKMPELITSVPQTDPSNASWRVDRYNQIAMDALGWGGPPFVTEQPAPRLAGAEHASGVLNTPPPKRWGTLPPLEGTARKPSEELGDPWGIGQFRLEPPTAHSFVEQAVSFESLSGGSSHFLDEPFAGAHRAD